MAPPTGPSICVTRRSAFSCAETSRSEIRDDFELGAEAHPSSTLAAQPFGHFAAQSCSARFKAFRLVWHTTLSSLHHRQRQLRFATPPLEQARPCQRHTDVLGRA